MATTETEKICLEEISHLVLDAGKNVTLPMLSHNHGLPFIKCSEILNQWLKSNKIHAGKVSCSYFVQYIDESGNRTVAVVSYDKLKSLKVKEKIKNLSEMLYGILLTSTNRSTGLKENYENVHVPIKASFQMRNIKQRPVLAVTEPKIHIKSEKVTNAGTKNISNIFGQGSTSKEVKKEPFKPKESPVKTEKKESPPKKESPKKASKTVSTGKGNIASFFSKGAAKPTSVAKPNVDVKPEPETTQKSKEEIVPKKRVSNIIDSDDDDEVIPNTPQEKRVRNQKQKKPAPKLKSSKNHSRIAVIEDSSESEAEEEREIKRKEQKIEVNVSDEEEEPPKKETKVEAPAPATNKRRKAIRTVIRKYQDENGFMVTRKETEEYELSDNEPEPVEKKSKSASVTEQKSDNAKPVAKTKQKNIMSFFNRK